MIDKFKNFKIQENSGINFRTLEEKIKEVESLIKHIEEGKASNDYLEDELNLELIILKNQLFILNTLNSLS